jgi:sulfate/thiosulfate transport system substrate-binding protein
MSFMSRRRPAAVLAAAVLSSLALAACASTEASTDGAGSGGGSEEVTLSLVAYSTPQAAFEEIIAAFQETDAGANVKFEQSYGASGDQSRAVEAGLPADFVMFSLETDMTRLVDAGMVDAGWSAGEDKGILTESVVALVTREGNPKGVRSWADLTRKDVEVITPNPFSSGGARWNIMAGYGAQIEGGKTPAEAEQYLADLLGNVPVQDESARAALQTFSGGKGDVLISYENEAIFAQQNGEAIDYVVPDSTILIENPAAITSTTKHPEEAQAFLDFVHSDEAQKIFAKNGYRPTLDGADTAGQDFPEPPGLFTIADLGGWTDVATEFFDADKGIVTDIERQLGVSVEK